jgi:hypothetical protein
MKWPSAQTPAKTGNVRMAIPCRMNLLITDNLIRKFFDCRQKFIA